MIQPHGIAALDRWGLLDDVRATGCPPIEQSSFDFGPVTITGRPHPVDGHATTIAPRRTVLDKILLDAAAAAGVEVREAFTVDEVIFDDGAVVGIRGHADDGSHVVERARVVIGADGHNSRVARAVDADRYHEKPMLENAFYTFWRDLPVDGMVTTIRGDRGFAAIPTNDDLTLVLVGCPYAQAAQFRSDVASNYFAALDRAPGFSERVAAATQEGRFMSGGVPNFYRTPFGPGWVLVGDAGFTKDPITAQGICNAFIDAERVAERPRRRLDRRSVVRPTDGRLPIGAGRRDIADVRVHDPDGDTRATAARTAATARGDRRQPDRHGRLCQRALRNDVPPRVLPTRPPRDRPRRRPLRVRRRSPTASCERSGWLP